MTLPKSFLINEYCDRAFWYKCFFKDAANHLDIISDYHSRFNKQEKDIENKFFDVICPFIEYVNNKRIVNSSKCDLAECLGHMRSTRRIIDNPNPTQYISNLGDHILKIAQLAPNYCDKKVLYRIIIAGATLYYLETPLQAGWEKPLTKDIDAIAMDILDRNKK